MPKRPEIQQLDIELILKAFELVPGQRIYIQCFGWTESGIRKRELIKVKLHLSRLYPDECSNIRINNTKRGGKFYVFLENTGKAPFIAYEQTPEGKYRELFVTPETEMTRRIKLMIEDGYTR